MYSDIAKELLEAMAKIAPNPYLQAILIIILFYAMAKILDVIVNRVLGRWVKRPSSPWMTRFSAFSQARICEHHAFRSGHGDRTAVRTGNASFSDPERVENSGYISVGSGRCPLHEVVASAGEL